MAHFLTLVLVEPNESDPAAKAESMMMPYFELDSLHADIKCDGFVIGGRYDGDIWGKEQNYNLSPEEFQARYGLDKIKDEDNIRPLTELRPGFVAYAVVTPDGKWHDCEDVDHSEWPGIFEEILARYPGYLGVGIDCHC